MTLKYPVVVSIVTTALLAGSGALASAEPTTRDCLVSAVAAQSNMSDVGNIAISSQSKKKSKKAGKKCAPEHKAAGHC